MFKNIFPRDECFERLLQTEVWYKLHVLPVLLDEDNIMQINILILSIFGITLKSFYLIPQIYMYIQLRYRYYENKLLITWIMVISKMTAGFSRLFYDVFKIYWKRIQLWSIYEKPIEIL